MDQETKSSAQELGKTKGELEKAKVHIGNLEKELRTQKDQKDEKKGDLEGQLKAKDKEIQETKQKLE